MTLQPRNPNITFLDLETRKPKCTFNQCIEKFVICEDGPAKRPVARGRPVVTKPIKVHVCSECGRKVQETDADAAADAVVDIK